MGGSGIGLIMADDRGAIGCQPVFLAEIADQRGGFAILRISRRQGIKMLDRAVTARIVCPACLDRDMLYAHAAPVRAARMPGSVCLADELHNFAILADQIVRAGLGAGIAEGVDRARRRRRIGDVNHDPIDRCPGAATGERGRRNDPRGPGIICCGQVKRAGGGWGNRLGVGPCLDPAGFGIDA